MLQPVIASTNVPAKPCLNNLITMRAILILTLAITPLLFGCNRSDDYQWHLPPGFPAPTVPDDNLMSAPKVELGRHLFYDIRLSANRTQSCASCHRQAHAFAEPRRTAVGSTGEIHRRNTLSLTNVAYHSTFTWAHGSLASIERQMLIPLFGESPIELGLGGIEEEVLQRFENDPLYQNLFSEAFGSAAQINWRNAVDSLACFVRSLISFNSPFDRYAYYQDDSAMSDAALRGLNLFMSERLECRHCHGGFNFTGASTHFAADVQPFHNIGLYYPTDMTAELFDQGLFEVTGKEEDKGRFRTPTLRNIEYTAPYMHDGSIETLDEVIQFYADGGRNILDGGLKGDGRIHPNKDLFVKGFELTENEKQDLLEFLKSLSDVTFITNKDFSDPFSKKLD